MSSSPNVGSGNGFDQSSFSSIAPKPYLEGKVSAFHNARRLLIRSESTSDPISRIQRVSSFSLVQSREISGESQSIALNSDKSEGFFKKLFSQKFVTLMVKEGKESPVQKVEASIEDIARITGLSRKEVIEQAKTGEGLLEKRINQVLTGVSSPTQQSSVSDGNYESNPLSQMSGGLPSPSQRSTPSISKENEDDVQILPLDSTREVLRDIKNELNKIDIEKRDAPFAENKHNFQIMKNALDMFKRHIESADFDVSKRREVEGLLNQADDNFSHLTLNPIYATPQNFSETVASLENVLLSLVKPNKSVGLPAELKNEMNNGVGQSSVMELLKLVEPKVTEYLDVQGLVDLAYEKAKVTLDDNLFRNANRLQEMIDNNRIDPGTPVIIPSRPRSNDALQ